MVDPGRPLRGWVYPRGSRLMPKVNLETGIEIWDGLPGSGKSYGATEFLLNVILKQRRPVFTNLPLRFRVLRRYLVVKSGDAMAARYIQHVSRDHFSRFVERNQLLTEFGEVMKGEGWSHAKIERTFCEQEGEHTYVGSQADWFYPGSVFIFDEFHRWADQRLQKVENPAFLNYATMHRHHLHWIILLTQDKMQVSLPWRRNCSKFIHCSDKRRLPFLFGLKLPIPAFAYEEFPAEMLDAGDHKRAKPIQTTVRIPFFNTGTIWRMYDSFTHMGGYRRLANKLDEVRCLIEGAPASASEKEEDMPRRRRLALLTPLLLLACLIALGCVLWQGGRSRGPVHLPPSVERPAATGVTPVLPQRPPPPPQPETSPPPPPPPPPVQSPPSTQPVDLPPPLEVQLPALPKFPGRLTVVAGPFVVVDSQKVVKGHTYAGWQLLGTDPASGGSLWEKDGYRVDVSLGQLSAPRADTRSGGRSLRELLQPAAPPGRDGPDPEPTPPGP